MCSTSSKAHEEVSGDICAKYIRFHRQLSALLDVVRGLSMPLAISDAAIAAGGISGSHWVTKTCLGPIWGRKLGTQRKSEKGGIVARLHDQHCPYRDESRLLHFHTPDQKKSNGRLTHALDQSAAAYAHAAALPEYEYPACLTSTCSALRVYGGLIGYSRRYDDSRARRGDFYRITKS